MYYFFLDESGSHSYKNIEGNSIFVLVGSIFGVYPSYLNYLKAIMGMFDLKKKYFNDYYTILHTREITNCEGAFTKLNNVRERME